jgi:hypothetical protein
MPLALLFVGGGALVFGAAAGGAALEALRGGRWASAGRRGVAGLLLLALGGLAGAIAIGLRGYRALTLEVLAATVTTEPEGPQRFRATILFPDKRLAMYDLAGDAVGVDAHILKWHPWVNILGLHTAYELDRVTGRYRDVTEERTKPHTAYALARPTPVDLFAIARRRLLGPLVDAEYGSAAFVPAATHAEYEVRVSTSGLLMRQVPPTSTP